MKRSPTILRAVRPTFLSILGVAWIFSPTGGVAEAAPPPALWQQQPAAAGEETKTSAADAAEQSSSSGSSQSPRSAELDRHGQATAEEAEKGKADERKRVAQEEGGQDPTMDHLPEEQMRKMIREEMEKAQKPFEYHGYLRSGFGFNGKLGDQDAFLAPGAGAKYRLGNETETYGEAIFINNWIRPEEAADTLFFKTEFLLTFVTANDSNFDATDIFTIREAFAQAGGFMASKPDFKVWAGQRYYHRHDTHIHDFFYLSMSGYGGGFEDLKLGSDAAGKLAGGYFGASVTDDALITDNGRPVKHVLDLRLEDVQLGGLATFWVAGAHYQGGDVGGMADAVPNSNGFAVGLLHTIPEFLGGFNKFVVQFGTGPLVDYDVFFKQPIDQPGSPADVEPGIKNVTVDEAYRVRVLDAVVFEPSPLLSFMGTVLFQQTDYGADSDSGEMWISAGGRPIFHFTDHVNVAFEAGLDYVKSDFGPDGDENGESDGGYLAKLTVAPQISAARNFFGRPTVRAYLTYAFWAEEFQGEIGGPAYVEDTAGLIAGLQMESWW
jgi:maltoporin